MDVPEGLKGTYDAVTVRRVYGDPIERDGVTLIPVAAVRGGFGYGGGGTEGGGGGSGVSARPVGMYRIEGGKLSWQPALDVTRIAMAGQIVAVVALLVLRSVLKSRRRRRRR